MFLSSLRFADRSLLRSPGFTLLAIITLGLGIGQLAMILGVGELAILWLLIWGAKEQTSGRAVSAPIAA